MHHQYSQILMARARLVKERVVSSFNASTMIPMSKTGMAVEERMFLKMQNWRHYFMKSRVKRKRDWQYHWVTQQAISKRLRAMEMIQKQVIWMPYDLKPRDDWTVFVCLWKAAWRAKKGFLHRIMTEDEKWIHYDNPKCRKSWGFPGHASMSTAKPNIHSLKVMLCIWCDQLSVVLSC